MQNLQTKCECSKSFCSPVINPHVITRMVGQKYVYIHIDLSL